MKLIALLFMIAAAAGAAPAQMLPMTLTPRVAAPWKVAGVGLGMSPAEVSAALKAAGYALDYRYMGRSWQGEVAAKVSFLRGITIPSGAQVISKEDYRKG
jgi:hypothetical protein